MTSTPQRKGKFDNGRCFICMSSESPGHPLVESRWKLHRIWLCENHAQVIAKRMRERGQSRDEVVEDMVDSALDVLGPALGLNVKPSGRVRAAKSAEQAEQAAAAEPLDQEDLDDMAAVARLADNEKCSVCSALGDGVELRRHVQQGTTFHLCPRDERTVLGLVDGGLSWEAAVHRAGADLFQQMLDPEITRQVRRRLRGEE